MGLFGGDYGISEFIYRRLNGFKEHLPKSSQDTIAKFIEKTIIIFSIAGPIMTFPQVIKIFSEQSAGGLSLITWGSYLFLSTFWLVYGVFIGNRPIVLATRYG
jgi:hypothetical protein